MDKITQYILTSGLGDWASILGVAIAVIGFAVTIYNILKSKKELRRVKSSFLIAKSMVDFSATMVLMEEIKRLQREGEWKIVLDRYSILKKSLIFIREANPDLSNEQYAGIQDAITSFSKVEEKVEKVLERQLTIDNVSNLNRIVSRQVEALQRIFVQLQNRIDR
ncbi:MAG: hypothetical protein JW765_01200 [Deltaproteobacteria bacterium]|nr:hypothetical protein [Candidatus Zymogenaceae bacterium]